MLKRFMQFKFTRLIILFLLIIPISVRAETIDRIIAKVGTDILTLSDVKNAVPLQRFYLLQTYGPKKGMKEFHKFKNNVLDELIIEHVLKSQIEEAEITVTAVDVEQEYKARLQRVRKSEPTFLKELMQQGLSLADYKAKIRLEIGRGLLVQKKIMPTISISDYDLQKEYEIRKSEFLVYKKLRFVQVFLDSTMYQDQAKMMNIAKQIHARLVKNKSAAALIKEHSSGPFAKKGGDSGLIDSSQIRDDISQLMAKLKPGESSPVLTTPQGIFVFKLLEKADPKPMPFNKVVNALRSQYGEKVVKDELRKYLLAVKDQTYVEIVK
jgi:peptidyl-prolyl cis-trans isomerase SurA